MKRPTSNKSKTVTKQTAPQKKAAASASKKPKSGSGQAASIEQLDEIDRQLSALLASRVTVLQSVLEQAKQSGQPLALLELQHRATAIATAAARDHQLSEPLFAGWIKYAVSLCQHEVRLHQPIAYLGPIYSYSYLAAVKHFGSAASLVPVASIAAVFDELVRGQAAFGVVPIENSTDGRVVDTLGMFARWPVRVCGEVLLPVHHCLLGRCPRGEITEVYSKPQALSQCRGWLGQHVPEARLIEVASTAAAARLAAEKPGVAAIASFEAGVHHGLDVIDENIEDNSHNVTRFAVIGNRPCEPTGRDKTSLMFQLKHQPGALADAMVIFREAKINLTWIESFPLPSHPNEYLFFIELEGHEKSKSISGALQKLRAQTLRLEILGSYARGE
jgi:chorismate mutase/prephenate dehydratase